MINIPTRAHLVCNFFGLTKLGLKSLLVRPIKRAFPEPWNPKASSLKPQASPHCKSVTKLSQSQVSSLKSQPWRNWTKPKATPMDLRNQKKKKRRSTWGISLVLFHRKSLSLQNLLPKRSVYALFGSPELCDNNNCQNCLGFYRFYNLLHSLVLNSTFFSPSLLSQRVIAPVFHKLFDNETLPLEYF